MRKATETLVKAAQQASANVTEEESLMKPKMTGNVMKGFRMELEVQEEIARKKKELEKFQEQLAKIRRERAGHH